MLTVKGVPQGPGKLEIFLPRIDEGAGSLSKQEIGSRVKGKTMKERLQVDSGPVCRQQAEQAGDVSLDNAQIGNLFPREVGPKQRPRSSPLVAVAGKDALTEERSHDALSAAEGEVLKPQ